MAVSSAWLFCTKRRRANSPQREQSLLLQYVSPIQMQKHRPNQEHLLKIPLRGRLPPAQPSLLALVPSIDQLFPNLHRLPLDLQPDTIVQSLSRGGAVADGILAESVKSLERLGGGLSGEDRSGCAGEGHERLLEVRGSIGMRGRRGRSGGAGLWETAQVSEGCTRLLASENSPFGFSTSFFDPAFSSPVASPSRFLVDDAGGGPGGGATGLPFLGTGWPEHSEVVESSAGSILASLRGGEPERPLIRRVGRARARAARSQRGSRGFASTTSRSVAAHHAP